MDNKKPSKELEEILSVGEAWLRQNGIITPIVHNSIVINLYVMFKDVKYLEYYMDIYSKKIDLTIYTSFWVVFKNLLKTVFRSNKPLLSDEVTMALLEYLPDYNIKVKMRVYKPEVEKDAPLSNISS
jgi:hypothetical protein